MKGRDFIESVRRHVRRAQLLAGGEHLLLAVSGGADSVAMLAALRQMAPGLKLRLTVAHLNHRIRGATADKDAAWVRRFAQANGLPCVCHSEDVPTLSRQDNLSLEMAARQARYRFFADAARQTGADAVATAHTADDVAETVLLQLLRGAGPAGLDGIAPEIRIDGLRVIRPLLDVTRPQVVAFLKDLGLDWREDDTNRDLDIPRNRVRHRLLPMLAQEFNPAVGRALVRTAGILRAENEWLDGLAADLLRQAEDTQNSLDVRVLRNLPQAALRRVLRLWLIGLGLPDAGVDFEAIRQVEALITGRKDTGIARLAAGWSVRRQAGILRAVSGGETMPALPFHVALQVPGETEIAAAGVKVCIQIKPGIQTSARQQAGAIPSRASISRKALGRKKLYVRSWQPGDRMRPLGMTGSKKVQDIFTDAKILRERRSTVPIFVCGGEVVWIPGYRIAAGWEVLNETTPCVQISVDPLVSE